MKKQLVVTARILMCCLAFVSSLMALPCQAHESSARQTLQLSPEEKHWLRDHPIVRIGVDSGYAPYSFFDKQGRFQGVAADFLGRIADLLGIRLDVVGGLSWPQILDAARAHRLDLIPTTVKLPERETYLSFSEIYIPTPLVIVTRDTAPRLTSTDQLSQMQVALVKRYSSSQQAMQRYPTIKPHFVSTPVEGLRAVASGQADAYIGVLGINTHLMNQYGLSNLKINAAFDMDKNGQRFAVRKDWAMLAGLLDKALRAIPAADKQAIFSRWLPVQAEQVPVLGTQLSIADQRWLETHRRIRVGIQRNNVPFDFIGPDGQHAGIAADYLALIEQQTALTFDRIQADDQAQLLKMLQDKKIDLVVAAAGDQPQVSGVVVSTPYHHTSLMLYSRDNAHYSGSIGELDGKIVALRQGGFAPRLLKNRNNIRMLTVSDYKAALQAVANGHADVALLAATPALNEMESDNIEGVRAAALLADSNIPLQYAARSEWKNLVVAINHVLAMVTPEQNSIILRKWLVRSPTAVLDRTLVMHWVLGLGAFVSLLYLAILLWNRQLRREIARRSSEAVKLLRDRENAVATREEAQRALHQSESELASVFQALPDLFFRMARDGTILGYRAGDASELYRPPEAFMGKRMQDVLPPELGRQFGEKLKQLHEKGEQLSFEYDLAIADRELHFEARLIPLADSDELVAIVRDITQQNLARTALLESEERLKDAHAELERRVDERTAELRVANRELETFGYSVSHDLRAPLRAISGFSETFMDEYGGTLDAAGKDYIQRILNGCRRMSEMIEGLLKLSRSSRGILERTQIDLSGLAAEVIEELRAADPKHRPEVDIQAGITAYGDARLIESVLENLLGNAWKYTVGNPAPSLSLYTKRQGDGWIYYIEDNGPGFDMAYVEQLFTPFQRLHSQADYPGIGIGLATVQRIIHRHGGRIWAHSEPGKGARFCFTLRPGIADAAMQQPAAEIA